MITLAAWLHTIDPFIWRISGDFGVRWYGASYVLGFIIGFVLLRWIVRRGLSPVPLDRVGDAILWLVGGILLGGRLGYVLFYQPALAITWLDHAPYWGVLAITEGGMASHGAMIGLAIAAWRVSKGFKPLAWDLPNPTPAEIERARATRLGKSSWLHVLDLVALLAPPGVLLGRLANFINGELLGSIITPPGKPGPWYAVQFPQELLLPAKLIPALQDRAATEALAQLAEQAAPNRPFDVGLRTLATNAAQFSDQLRPLLSSRHPSQLYQAFAEGLVLTIVLWLVWMKPRRPGVIFGLCLIVYGILRVLTELWRLPDAHLAVARPLGLSRGQWLSIAMVALGFAVLAVVRRRAETPMGGWRSSKPVSAQLD